MDFTQIMGAKNFDEGHQMTHNDSHLMALIDELKQSHNVMDQREVKTLQVIEGLLKRIELLEQRQNTFSAYAQRQLNNALTSGRY